MNSSDNIKTNFFLNLQNFLNFLIVSISLVHLKYQISLHLQFSPPLLYTSLLFAQYLSQGFIFVLELYIENSLLNQTQDKSPYLDLYFSVLIRINGLISQKNKVIEESITLDFSKKIKDYPSHIFQNNDKLIAVNTNLY